MVLLGAPQLLTEARREIFEPVSFLFKAAIFSSATSTIVALNHRQDVQEVSESMCRVTCLDMDHAQLETQATSGKLIVGLPLVSI